MRLAKVIAILLTLGALTGAIVGTLFLFGVLVFGPHDPLGANAKMYGAAAGFGARVGALSGPPIALLLLRRVPLWRATVETAAGAGLGAAIGGMTTLRYGWAYMALAFALAAAFRLRYAYREPKAALAQPRANEKS
jgi:hypothetical protein